MTQQETEGRRPDLAELLSSGRAGEPVAVDLSTLRDLAQALSTPDRRLRLHVTLFGGHAIAQFPALSSQQLIVSKSFGRRLDRDDFSFADRVDVVGESTVVGSFGRFALEALLRHGWWLATGWIALWWLVMVLGDYAFAARLGELALSGSVVTFVLFKLIWRVRFDPSDRDRAVAGGVWQLLAAGERNVGRLLGVAGTVALLAVLFSHSTMAALEMRGYFDPLTAAPARALIVAGLTAGSVMLLAVSLAAISDLRRRRDVLLVECEAAAAIAANGRLRGEGESP